MKEEIKENEITNVFFFFFKWNLLWTQIPEQKKRHLPLLFFLQFVSQLLKKENTDELLT